MNQIVKGGSEGHMERVLGFDDTELRLGLPGDMGRCRHMMGDNNGREANACGRKRGFQEMIGRVDLMLNLGSSSVAADLIYSSERIRDQNPDNKHPAKALVVGWPPIRAFRKNAITAGKQNAQKEASEKAQHPMFVKVGVDGAPFLRKVDLKMFNSYQDLSQALSLMFSSAGNGRVGEDKETTDYVPTYKDKDGDWMLVGDVPWEMFIESCKRMRIMRSNESDGFGV